MSSKIYLTSTFCKFLKTERKTHTGIAANMLSTRLGKSTSWLGKIENRKVETLEKADFEALMKKIHDRSYIPEILQTFLQRVIEEERMVNKVLPQTFIDSVKTEQVSEMDFDEELEVELRNFSSMMRSKMKNSDSFWLRYALVKMLQTLIHNMSVNPKETFAKLLKNQHSNKPDVDEENLKKTRKAITQLDRMFQSTTITHKMRKDFDNILPDTDLSLKTHTHQLTLMELALFKEKLLSVEKTLINRLKKKQEQIEFQLNMLADEHYQLHQFDGMAIEHNVDCRDSDEVNAEDQINHDDWISLI